MEDYIELGPEDLRVIAKYMPAIRAGKTAEAVVADFVTAILRHSGKDPTSKYMISGNRLILQAPE